MNCNFGWRAGALGLITITGLLLALATGCTNSPDALQLSYQEANGAKDAAAARASSKLSVTARIARTTTSCTVTLSCTGTTLVEGKLFFTDGTSTVKNLSGTSGALTTSKTNLWYVRAKVGSGDYWYFDKSGDYWYFDRGGAWKPASTTSTSRSGSGYKGRGNDRSDGDFDEDVVTSTAILTTGGDQISVTFDDGTVSANSTSGLASIEAVYRYGNSDECDLDGKKDKGSLGKDSTECEYYVLTTGDGTNWYFDSEGRHLPKGQVNKLDNDDDDDRDCGNGRRKGARGLLGTLLGATLKVLARVSDGKWYFDSSLLSGRVLAYYADGRRFETVNGGLGLDLGRLGALSYVEVKPRGNSGDKWYFDNLGNALTTGYAPTVNARIQDGSLFLQSSDVYERVRVLSGGEVSSFIVSERGGCYAVPGPIDGFMVRLKSDGSKWYFDKLGVPVPLGDKWFADMD